MRDEKEIFLHACCGPCAEWPVSELVSEDYKITMFYHNPNIHPRFEHQRRLQNLKIVSDLWQIPLLVTDEYREDLWTERAYLESDKDRCHMCYRLRMDKTAEVAKNLGFQFFSTTLLVSPYQRHEAIMEAGHAAAQKYGLTFLYRDFRPGFRQGQQMARDHGLYRQKYCGCILSLQESSFKEKIYKDFAGSTGET